MKKWPRISIITPSFNQANFIEKTIRSVLDQKYPNLEYIVMDGESTDGTIEILKKWGKKIIWYSRKDNGQSDAINKGIKLATGEIIGYLNSDDLLLKNSLFRIFQAFKDKNVNWVTGNCKIINEKDREVRSYITAYKKFLLKFINKNFLLVINPISQPGSFWRREVTDKIGQFNKEEHLCMDYDYWLRMINFYKLTYIKDNLSAFRVHESSKSSRRLVDHFRDELSVAKKYTNNKIILFLHYLNFLSIIIGYNIIETFMAD